MLKKILSICLAVMILTGASSVGVFAAANGDETSKTAAAEKSAGASNLKTIVNAQTGPTTAINPSKSTLADYQRAQRRGNKFSTKTKVLIGVGIAAAVVGIVVFAASRDKIRTF
jgi:hypothetical protein